MTPVAIVSVFIGIVIIIARGPLIPAPQATRALYLRLMANNTRVRLIGLFIAAVAASSILTARAHLQAHAHTDPDPQTAAIFMLYLGYFLAAGPALVFLVFTTFVRRTARAVLDAMDNAVLRWLGIFSLLLAAFFIYLGIEVLN